jgi:hypothetical protein
MYKVYVLGFGFAHLAFLFKAHIRRLAVGGSNPPFATKSKIQPPIGGFFIYAQRVFNQQRFSLSNKFVEFL